MLTMGVDIGSTSSKAVVLRDGTELIAEKVVPIGTGPVGPAMVYRETLELAGIQRSDIARLVVTGYGRLTFEGADQQISELSCHAKGMHFLNPETRTLIDIGGQDVKAMRLGPSGRLENFVMNDKCAAGTGRFLEVMAKVLNVSVQEMGALSAQAREAVTISNTCTVFAESEVISQLAGNAAPTDIAAGIHRSVAKRVASLASRVGVEPLVAMSGGVALNTGIVRAMEEELKQPVFVSPRCQLAGAVGAAVFAYETASKA